MVYQLKTIIVIAVTSLISIAQPLDAQLFKSTYRSGDSEPTTPNFSFSTSVGLSLTGPVYKSEFKMIDELGLEYDVMSLLDNQSIREGIQLTDEQFASMTKIKNKLNSNVAEFIKSMTNEKMDDVKAQIIETEVVLNAILEPKQFQRLQQLRNQLGINRFGMASYLSSKSMLAAMKMSGDEGNEFKSKTELLKQKFSEKSAAAQRNANLKLLSHLTKRQRSKIKQIFDEKKYEQFLTSRLFSDSKPKLRKLDRNRVAMLDALQNPKVRRALDIVDDQYGEIRKLKSEYDQRLTIASEKLFGEFSEGTSVTARAKELKKLSDRSHEEFEDQLRRILLDFQLDRLDQIIAEIEATQMGTVGSLCHGFLSNELPVKESEIKTLFDLGMKLEQERQQTAASLKAAFEQSVLALLSPDQEKRMAKLLGETADFNLR